MDSQKGFYPLEKMSFFLYNDVRHFQFPCSDMGIAVISDRFFYFVSVVLFSATQPQTSGLFWQLFLHPLLKPQSAQHTLPCLRSQLKILHFLAFDFSIFFHPLFLLFLFVFFTQPMFHKLHKPHCMLCFFHLFSVPFSDSC